MSRCKSLASPHYDVTVEELDLSRLWRNSGRVWPLLTITSQRQPVRSLAIQLTTEERNYAVTMERVTYQWLIMSPPGVCGFCGDHDPSMYDQSMTSLWPVYDHRHCVWPRQNLLSAEGRKPSSQRQRKVPGKFSQRPWRHTLAFWHSLTSDGWREDGGTTQ